MTASVRVAASKQDCAFMAVAEPTADRKVYRLRSIRDEEVWLVVERAEGEQEGTYTMRCQFGLFGDPERERALIDAVSRRLERLRGVEHRPVR